MYLETFNHQGFRNLGPGNFQLNERLNIFYGLNGAGKSSVLEGICFLTSGRSFRTAKIELVLAENSPNFSLFGRLSNCSKIGIGYVKQSKQKSIKVNGEKVSTLSSLSKLYPTQVLSPESYHLIDSGPSERRKFLDWCLFHVKHSYHETWKDYFLVLAQRNALLKRVRGQAFNEQIPYWDEQLYKAERLITKDREFVLAELKVEMQQVLSSLQVDFCNLFELKYYPGYTGDFRERLNDSLQLDKEYGYTRYGPHKADVRIKVNEQLAKEYLSRGQKKVIINALFLAQTALLKKLSNKDSLFVIDDFSSELDLHNQQALLDVLLKQDNVQIILSCLQLDSLSWLKKRYNSAHMFHVEQGVITPIAASATN